MTGVATIELHVEGMAQGGEGVGRYAGQVVFAAGGLPGEHVRVKLHERKANYMRGHVIEIMVPASERIAPRCADAHHMPWQHIAYDAQLRFKHTILREQLDKLAGLHDVPIAPVLAAAHPWHYRNTAHLHVQGHNQKVGYYAAGTRTVVDMPEDPLLLPVLNEALAGLRTVIPGRQWQAHMVTLRGSATYGYAVAVVRGSGQLHTLAKRWQQCTPVLAGCVISPDKPPNTDKGPRVRTSPKAPVLLHEEIGGIIFSLSPHSFFQVHTAQAAVLLRVVQNMLSLEAGERLLDAYSGAGAFALPIAQALHEVVAIEEHAAAVADAERSAHMNGVQGVLFVTGAVEHLLPTVQPPIAAAVLDPPRRGCHPAALAALTKLAPRRIAYISCHPGILARDMRVLLNTGHYHLVQIQPVDLFPQTPHIECVALLERVT